MLDNAGKVNIWDMSGFLKEELSVFNDMQYNHALKYMVDSGYFVINSDMLSFNGFTVDTELDFYVKDLIEYGLGQYDIDFGEGNEQGLFKIWGKYMKHQVLSLLCKNPQYKQKGTLIFDGVVYIFVTVEKANSINEDLKYMDGYIDNRTFQWETVKSVTQRELIDLKNSKKAELFVRKEENEGGKTLPFSYIGSGKMEFIEGSKQINGSYMFRIAMSEPAPEDLYFDFKLPE